MMIAVVELRVKRHIQVVESVRFSIVTLSGLSFLSYVAVFRYVLPCDAYKHCVNHPMTMFLSVCPSVCHNPELQSSQLFSSHRHFDFFILGVIG